MAQEEFKKNAMEQKQENKDFWRHAR